MADIFLSYARDDHDRVAPLVEHLIQAGWTVWYDRNLAGGSVFSVEIEKEITTARVVLVVWSDASIVSRWVADEAELGRDLGKLLPISLDGSSPPMGFRQFQAIDFSAWGGSMDNEAFVSLSRSISKFMEVEAVAPEKGAAATGPNSNRQNSIQKMAAISTSALIFLLVIIAVFYFIDRAEDGVSDVATIEDTRAAAVVAVLPFASLGGEAEQGYLADGIAYEVIANLQAMRLFPVISKSSSFVYRNSSLDVREIAKQLSADYLVEGTFQKSGENIRVSAQLIDATTAHVVWSNQYDRAYIEIFELQNELSRSIVATLAPELQRIEIDRAEGSQSNDLTAYDFYLRGLRLSRLDDFEETVQAREMLLKSLELDPEFAPALVQLAWLEHDYITYYFGETSFERSRQARENALEFAKKAVTVDPNYSEAQIVYGHMLLHYQKHGQGLAALLRGVELSPAIADHHSNLAWGLIAAGQADEGLEAFEMARTLNPQDPKLWEFYFQASYAYLYKGDYDKSIEWANRSLTLNPNNYFSLINLIYAYSKIDNKSAARQALKRFRTLMPNFSTKSLDLTSLPAELNEEMKETLFALGWIDPE